jgi:uncharacterized protein YidB (DUF937 family)
MTNSDGDRGSRSYMGVGNDGRGMTLDACRKLTETLREAGYRPICNSYISEEFQNQRPITSGTF